VLIIPAVDIKDGRCVRLTGGDFDRVKVYGEPEEAAERWLATGAQRLHVVNLDGADGNLDTNSPSARVVASICQRGLEVQLGGGLRSVRHLRYWAEMGVSDFIIGTAALDSNQALLQEMVAEYGSRVIISLDLALVPGSQEVGLQEKGPQGDDSQEVALMIKGWRSAASLGLAEALGRAFRLGVKRFIVTDTTRDGTLQGIDEILAGRILETFAASVEVDGGGGLPAGWNEGPELIWAGGVSHLSDLRTIKGLKFAGLRYFGAIVGKALYEGRFTLQEALIC